LAVQLEPNGISIRMNHLLPGRAYALEKSLDLANWQKVMLFAATGGTNQWPEPGPPSPQEFYRIRWKP